MKFTYSYKTSDGALHHGVFSASSKEAVYSSLKKNGVKPFDVRLAPGVFNRIRSFGFRWFAIVILAAAIITLLSVEFVKPVESDYEKGGSAKAIGRRQVWGDAAIIEQAVATNWRDVFDSPGECFLARYARPGVEVPQSILPSTFEDGLVAVVDRPIPVAADEMIEYKQVKAIVAGMKEELRAYLADGGTARGYISRLVERQSEEVRFLRSTERRLAAMSSDADAETMMVYSMAPAAVSS